MTSAHDPLHEPLRLLREASLPTGFEERLAERLATAQRQGKVVRFPVRKRVLLLVAAIAIPALAAAGAGGYYVQRRSSAASSESAPKQVEAKPLGHLPKTGLTVTVPRTEPAMPAIEKLSVPRSQAPSRPSNLDPKAEERRPNGPEPEKVVSPPAADAAPRIEALDPFVAKSTTSQQSAATPKAANVSESLRKVTEQGSSRSSDDSARGSRRDANENRGNDSAQQARERVQARERKGQ